MTDNDKTTGRAPTPDGWFPFGSFVDHPWIPREFSEELGEDGLPRWERPISDPLALSRVTRVTVVGKEGRVFEGWDLFEDGAFFTLQDDGRTLKILPR